jgi:putative acyl-CoA dehydrogenase
MHHAAHRSAFGRPLIAQPLMRNVLADLHLEVEGSLALTLRMARALDESAQEHERLLLRLGAAVGKYWICKRTPHHAYEAMECLGGNGVMENCILPRLYREAPINAIWEGSGNVQALDVLRALAKTPAVLEVWLAELNRAAGADARLDRAIRRLQDELADPSDREYRARALVDQLALTLQAALLTQAGCPPVAEAFIASRLGDRNERHSGTLPRGLALDPILERAHPDPS